MRTYKIAICDDEDFYVENIYHYLQAYKSEFSKEVSSHKYNNPEKLIEEMKSGDKYDIVFLDVDMPIMSGTDAASKIREFNRDVTICFVTAYEDYAYRAFQVDASGYLVKPVKYVDFKNLMQKCLQQIQYIEDRKTSEDKYIEIRTDRECVIVKLDDIIYIEKRRNQCVYHMVDCEISVYDTLLNVYEMLDKEKFHFVHQGFIVNFDFIKEVRTDRIFITRNLDIPLSRKYSKFIKELHMDKIRRLKNLQMQMNS